MKTITTQIEIAASPEVVWAILTDFESYPEWNPFIISMKGEARAGTFLDNRIKSNEKKEMRFQPEVLVAEANKEFRWKGKLFVKGLFDGEHYFVLEALANGSTLLIHGETFSGLLAGALLSMIKADTQAGFEAMNKALKQRAEATH